MRALNYRARVIGWIILVLCGACLASAGGDSIPAAAAGPVDRQSASCIPGDVDGDGQSECLYNLSPDPSAHGACQVQVWDRAGRELKGVITEARLIELADLDADGVPELLLERQRGTQASASLPTPCPCAKPGSELIAQLAIGLADSTGRLVTVFSFRTGDERPLDAYGDGRRDRSEGD